MLDEYIHQYGRRLFGLCMTLCAHRAEAEDLYQETWLRVLNNMDRYDPEKPFEPWLTRICVNLYRSSLRRLLRSPIWDRFDTDADKDRALELVRAEEPEDFSELHSAIAGLSDKLRIVVILYYFRDMDVSQVAEILNIPAGTVKSRLNKARNKLKEVLADETDLRF